MVNRVSNVKGSGIEVYLKSPNHEVIKQSFRQGFKDSNNEVEYEALIAGLWLAKKLRPCRLQVQSDSQLIMNQVLEEYIANYPKMEPYLAIVQLLKAHFDECAIQHVLWNLNAQTDALANFGSTFEPNF